MTLPVFQTFPLTTAAGAEIQGLDLSAPLSEDTTKRLRRIWLQHGVLFFRNQNLDPGVEILVSEKKHPMLEPDSSKPFRCIFGKWGREIESLNFCTCSSGQRKSLKNRKSHQGSIFFKRT